MALRFLIIFVLILVKAHFAVAKEGNVPFLISHDEYLSLHVEVRIDYIKAFRMYMAQLEQDLNPHQPAAMQKLFWISSAFAAEEFCLMGGLKRPFVGGKCSTFGNGCPENKDGFKCGPIFADSCISRTPVDDISQRCYFAAAKKDIPNPVEYTKLKLQAESDYKSFCEDAGRTASAGCQNFIAQMKTLNQKVLTDRPTKPQEAAESLDSLFTEIAKPIQIWRLQSYRGPISSLERLKKLADQNDDLQSNWLRSCANDPKKEVPANGVAFRFADITYHHYVSQMTQNEDGSWSIVLKTGTENHIRKLKEKDGKIIYTDSQGKDVPVELVQIHGKDVNTVFPLGYEGSNSCFTYRESSGSTPATPRGPLRRRPGQGSSSPGVS